MTPSTRLIEILDAEVRELRTLLEVAIEQERALVRGDAAGLDVTLNRHVAVIRAISELERERRACVDTVARATGATAPLTLSRLLVLVPAVAPRLAALRTELRNLVARLGAVNARNAYLIGRARDLLDGLARTVVAALGPEPAFVYVESGRPVRASSDPRLVDRRA